MPPKRQPPKKRTVIHESDEDDDGPTGKFDDGDSDDEESCDEGALEKISYKKGSHIIPGRPLGDERFVANDFERDMVYIVTRAGKTAATASRSSSRPSRTSCTRTRTTKAAVG